MPQVLSSVATADIPASAAFTHLPLILLSTWCCSGVELRKRQAEIDHFLVEVSSAQLHQRTNHRVTHRGIRQLPSGYWILGLPHPQSFRNDSRNRGNISQAGSVGRRACSGREVLQHFLVTEQSRLILRALSCIRIPLHASALIAAPSSWPAGFHKIHLQ